MRKILRRCLCCLLSIVLVFSTFIPTIAADIDSQTTTPVVVINDMDANPIYNTDDGSVIFDLRKYQYDLLFASGFSSEFANIITQDVINEIIKDEASVMNIATALLGAFGYEDDINRIVNTVLDLAIELLGSADLSNLDISSIFSSIDLKSYFASMFEEMKADIELLDYLEMNADGTPVYTYTGAITYTESLDYYYNDDYLFAYSVVGDIGESIAEKIGYENTYVFTYDWRIDPAINAENLDAFINHVKSVTGSEKVSVISEGYGSVIATEYLAEYEDEAATNIKNFVTVSSEFLGTSLVGDIFKGNIAEHNIFTITDYTSAYIRYTNDLSDNPITAFIMWLLNYIMNTEWELQDYCMDITAGLTSGYELFESRGVVEQLAYMPGLWALVPADDFDEAVDNMFGTEINDSLYKMIVDYKDNQDAGYDIIVNSKENGINISVVAAWDLQILPIGQNVSMQSDGVVDTEYASFGATCVDLNDVSYAMLAEQEIDDGHDHMSANYDMLTPWYSYGGACYYIDASTCALPENTWFIKNMKHGSFDIMSNSVAFLVWLVTSDVECTVWQDVAYKQFMTYNRYINPGVLMSDSVPAPDSESITGKYLMGDVNLDGVITAVDSQLAARIADGTDSVDEGTVQFMNADTDADGVITDLDAQYILDMSTGTIKEHSINIKVEPDTDVIPGMIKSECEIELSPVYNSVTNKVELTVSVLNAVGSYSGNFVIDYCEPMLTYDSVKCNEIENVFVAAGQPYGYGTKLTFAYSSSKSIASKQCDENGKLELATFYLDVTRKDITPTSLSAGSTYFYENGSHVYVNPVTVELDEDFFFMYGDADNSRYITPSDARYALRVAVGLEICPDDITSRRCDVDKNGVITPSDARLILRAATTLIDSFSPYQN